MEKQICTTEELKSIMDSFGLSLLKISEITYIPKYTLYNWYIGRRVPPYYCQEYLKIKLKEYKGQI